MKLLILVILSVLAVGGWGSSCNKAQVIQHCEDMWKEHTSAKALTNPEKNRSKKCCYANEVLECIKDGVKKIKKECNILQRNIHATFPSKKSIERLMKTSCDKKGNRKEYKYKSGCSCEYKLSGSLDKKRHRCSGAEASIISTFSLLPLLYLILH